MISTKRVVLLASALSLALYATLGAAQPGNDHPGNKGKGDRSNDYPPGSQQDSRYRAPVVDLGAVRVTLRDHRDLLAPASSLPPGSRKTSHVANHYRRVSPRKWTVACWDAYRTMKATSGNSWAAM
jgi:hypothetical protein